MDTEFVNAYINRMLALNSELTNKNVMLEAKIQILEKKYNDLAIQYNAMIEAQQQAPLEQIEEETKESKKAVKAKTEDEQF